MALEGEEHRYTRQFCLECLEKMPIPDRKRLVIGPTRISR